MHVHSRRKGINYASKVSGNKGYIVLHSVQYLKWFKSVLNGMLLQLCVFCVTTYNEPSKPLHEKCLYLRLIYGLQISINLDRAMCLEEKGNNRIKLMHPQQQRI